MAYQSGDKILDDHYNDFLTGSNDGTGTAGMNGLWGNSHAPADVGYNQTVTLSAASAGATVSATQWAGLLNQMTTMANHQGSSLTAITVPTAGDTINAYSALDTNRNLLWGNRNNAAAAGTNITTGGATSRTTSWGGASQQQGWQCFHTITFGNANQLEAFFNAGGIIKWSGTRTGGTASNKNTAWSNLLTALGTLTITGASANKTIAGTVYSGFTKIGGSGTPTINQTGNGVYAIATDDTWVLNFQQYDTTANYTANRVDFYIKRPNATQITIAANHTDLADANTDEQVDGTITGTCVLQQPSTTYLSNSWGTPTISSSNNLFA